MEENKKPLSFAFASKPRRPSRPPSCLATTGDDEGVDAAPPARQYVTEFDPTQTLAASPSAAAPRGIAPIPNREQLPPPTQAAADGSRGGDPMLRRYMEDMAALPDHGGMDEYRAVPVEGFGAALLGAYGWSEGNGIGRNNNKGDAKVAEFGRRLAGTQGLGYSPSEADPMKIMKSLRLS